MLTEQQLVFLTSFLNNVGEHRGCRAENNGLYPTRCLEAILTRYERYKLEEIAEELERELLAR